MNEYEEFIKEGIKYINRSIGREEVIPSMLGKQHSYETKQRMSKSAMGNTNSLGVKRSDETRRKLSEAALGNTNSLGHVPTEETKYKISKTLKGHTVSKETREKMSKGLRGKIPWITGKHHSKEARRKISIAHTGRKHTEKAKRNMRNSHPDQWGSNNPNWRGGVSYEPYCEKFNEEFKEYIRDTFGRMCFLCGKPEEDNGVKLSVHHVNYDKECLCRDKTCDFVPLCMKCHAPTSNNKKYWEQEIMELLEY